ncbi:molybdopterin synthase catalytic subunit MoaE [Pantoea sp. Aalb]|uniref:molybdopterin synthase catalytic subunit MoaE n=1 Tax=Pantoea sp. Aalb TaxID=2576762 RepID=UPI00132983A5|nr:molybdopterin synthase catalytic subunit MoaE [Pantoea sp. Aalb]MXP67519.1 molybdopterin synthase catalytic subunit MoaE [Pantoea sp. Aalb]
MKYRTRILVEDKPFNVAHEHKMLSYYDIEGVIVTFVGKVRNHNLGKKVLTLTLEHYPGMTEKILTNIVSDACNRWMLQKVTVIHRFGVLFPGDEIMFVGVSSAHRNNAFKASEFIIDFLKTSVPFWKKERTNDGDYWVNICDSDYRAVEKWKKCY